ncbi:MAG TPA: GWxTD domain-containing protein [Candidatus Sulfopaludibacter sp.]|jgi:GWxTD domain-containing protein|nr:GWxTD domain-containing protein [Candidatus Sulfopaludibacter sp.]
MIALQNWMTSPLAQALGWALFHFLWQGTLIAVLLAAILWFHRTPRARYLFASAAMAAMVLSFAATMALCWPAAEPTRQVGPGAMRHVPLAPAPDPAGRAAIDALKQPGPPPWLVPVWMGGVSLFYCYSLVAWLAATRLKKRGAFAAPLEWQRRMKELAAELGLRRSIALLESCLTDVPVVIGYLRPVILLPIGMLAGLTAAQVEAILIHELAHVRRYDYLANVMQTMVEGMLFYHPAVWWVGSLMRREREHCCDDVVVAQQGDARGYAVTLARLELSRSAREPALAATGGNLMKRIHRLQQGLMQQQEGPRAAAPLISAGVLLATATLGIAAWQTQTQPQPQNQPAQHLVEPLPHPMIEPMPQAASPRPLTPPELQARNKKLSSELETPYRKWLNEDVAYIITDEERAAFKRLETDAERENFIQQFWTRRDPTPGTVENEFKQEHYRRIAYTNARFASTVAGWKTDRGRIYISYGPPDEIEDHPATSTTAAYQQWRYKFIEGVGVNVIVEFIDPAQTNEYRMTMDPTEKDALARNPLIFTASVMPPAPAFGNTIANTTEVQPRKVTIAIPLDTLGHKTQVQGTILTASGKPVANVIDTANGTNSFSAYFNLVPGSYRARFLVRDQVDGKVRQGEITFDVQ